MRTHETGSGIDAASRPDTRPRSVLLIAEPTDASALRRALEASGTFGVAVAGGIDAARERLGRDEYDVVIFDVGVLEPSSIESVRAITPGADLIVRGAGEGAIGSGEGEADEWIEPGDSDGAVAACVRGAVERRRLREELRVREAELLESEARFRNIIERTPDGIMIVDRAGMVSFANPGAERMFARSAAELVGEDFGVVVVSGETTEMDIVRLNETDPIVAELRVSATTWNRLPAQIISLRDITDRKAAEERAQRLLLERAAREEAEKAGERSRFLADASATLDASLNAEATLAGLASQIVPHLGDWCVIDLLEGSRIRRVAGVHSDPAKQDLLHELKERFLPQAESSQPFGRVLQSGAPELHRALDPERLRELAADEEHASLLTRLGTRSTMTVPLEVRENRLGALTVACAERDLDETDLALAGEIASRAARALDNARLFETALVANRVKSDFLAVMSHELRTPLTAILGYADLLLDGIVGEIDDNQTRYLRRIRAGATQLLEIIQEILTYAQTEAGLEQARPRAIRMGDLVDEIVAVAEPLVRGKGLEFRLQVEQRDATLYTDVGKLRQIMLNLLTNAVKFTDSGAVELTVALEADVLSIAVADTGIGIVADAVEGIFDPFQQVEQGTTRRVGGIGLGLSVSRQLAELLGGTVSVESREGHGSTFTLSLPSQPAP